MIVRNAKAGVWRKLEIKTKTIVKVKKTPTRTPLR